MDVYVEDDVSQIDGHIHLIFQLNALQRNLCWSMYNGLCRSMHSIPSSYANFVMTNICKLCSIPYRYELIVIHLKNNYDFQSKLNFNQENTIKSKEN